jgi:hypothetical protein
VKVLLRSAAGGVLAAVVVVAAAYFLRHDALAGQARQAHEPLTTYMAWGGAAVAVAVTLALAAIGSMRRPRRSRRALRGRAVSW